MDVNEKHAAEIGSLPDDERLNRLCELNVIEQAMNICQTTIVEDVWARGQELTVHGVIYGLHDGLLRDLCVSATSLDRTDPKLFQPGSSGGPAASL
jgi:carbonic anhydrase